VVLANPIAQFVRAPAPARALFWPPTLEARVWRGAPCARKAGKVCRVDALVADERDGE
jgi:hypothetical protein